MNTKIILIASLVLLSSVAMAEQGLKPPHNPCPEPASMATLVIGGIAALRKRAR
jgi:hypothetical protein